MDAANNELVVTGEVGDELGDASRRRSSLPRSRTKCWPTAIRI